MKLRDSLWLWGQEPDGHGGPQYNIPTGNAIDCVQGAAWLGIPNCCRVVLQGKPEPPFEPESRRLQGFRQVVWSGIGDSGSKRNDGGHDDVDEVLRQAGLFPNVTGCLMDDFFRAGEARISQERMQEIRTALHLAGLKLWLVCYDLHWPKLDKYLNFFDVITFWTWNGDHLAQLDENLEKLQQRVPDKLRLAGCYLWNYGQ